MRKEEFNMETYLLHEEPHPKKKSRIQQTDLPQKGGLLTELSFNRYSLTQ